ncbi:unnamed protein product [Meloidogyne enterolobii]|uniref:Uncharacterized protein n=2 Tax=Meloidogyne enterolobii TaxID=390850 RepID=A0ACB1B4N1_MELEN
MAPDMFPVRVLVETVRSQHCIGCAHDGNPLVDTFAVVGGQTMLSQLVETVLAALGLPQLIQDSKGKKIKVKNFWGQFFIYFLINFILFGVYLLKN